MPSKKSMRVSLRNARHNRIAKSAARTAVAVARRITATGSREESVAAVATAASALDRAAKRGAIHRKNASRRKSRLARRLRAMGQPE